MKFTPRDMELLSVSVHAIVVLNITCILHYKVNILSVAICAGIKPMTFALLLECDTVVLHELRREYLY